MDEEYENTFPLARKGTGQRAQAKRMAAAFTYYFVGSLLFSDRFFASLALAVAMSLLTIPNYGRDAIALFGIGLLVAGLIRFLGVVPS
jgi:hypothetical protein